MTTPMVIFDVGMDDDDSYDVTKSHLRITGITSRIYLTHSYFIYNHVHINTYTYIYIYIFNPVKLRKRQLQNLLRVQQFSMTTKQSR